MTSLCPPELDRLAVGSDYRLPGGGPFPTFVNRYLVVPGAGLITGSAAHFFAANFDTPDASSSRS